MATYSRAEWNDLINQVIQLGTDCDLSIDLDEVDPNHIWAKSDIRGIRDALIQICSENASESQGGTGDGDAPFNDEFAETLDNGLWHQDFIDAIQEAIANGCCSDCCWEMSIDVSIDFPGNVIPQPVSFGWRMPGACGEENEAGMRAAIMAAVEAAFAADEQFIGIPQEYLDTIAFVETGLTDAATPVEGCGEGNEVPTILES